MIEAVQVTTEKEVILTGAEVETDEATEEEEEEETTDEAGEEIEDTEGTEAMEEETTGISTPPMAGAKFLMTRLPLSNPSSTPTPSRGLDLRSQRSVRTAKFEF